jgi:hypothetical protein
MCNESFIEARHSMMLKITHAFTTGRAKRKALFWTQPIFA